jgi:hypothetical protein
MMPVLVSLYRRIFQLDGVAHSNTLHQDVAAFSQGALAELIVTAPTLTGEANAQSAAAKQSVSAGMEGGVGIDQTAMEIHLENFLTTYADLVGSATVATGAGPAAVEARELRSRLAVVQCYEAVHGCGSVAFTDAAQRMLCGSGVLDGAGVKVGTVLQCHAYLSARATRSAAAAAVFDTFAAAAVQRFPLANALGGSAGDIVMLVDDAGAGLEAP